MIAEEAENAESFNTEATGVTEAVFRGHPQ